MSYYKLYMDFTIMKESSTLVAFIGILGIVTGFTLVNVSNYGLPPLPTGYVLSMILLILGAIES